MFRDKAYAKINWSLYVLNKRQDSYHNIVSLIHAINLYDVLIFEDSLDIKIETNFPIKKEKNLVYKAVKAIHDYAGIDYGIKITLNKNIPVGSGLGGGSSDAATTLKVLNKLWKLGLSNEELKEIAIKLGSDIPFFLYPPICIVEGKGDIIKPLKIDKSYNLLLVKPDFHISTKWAYSALDAKKRKLTENYALINNNIWQLYNNICCFDITKLKLWNDLEEVVSEKYPEIKTIKEKLLETGAKASLMSGSGSVVFGIFEKQEDAERAIKNFKGYWCKSVQTLTG